MWYRETPVGRIGIDADASCAITRIALPGTSSEEPASDAPEPQVVQEAFLQLEEYFAGKRRSFDLKLQPEGTPFQRLVWQALETIPYGECRSYGEIAALIGRPGAARAVGMANHHNPIAIVIPCHRVIGANGKLTGYGGGLPLKQRLLALEAQNSRRKTESRRS